MFSDASAAGICLFVIPPLEVSDIFQIPPLEVYPFFQIPPLKVSDVFIALEGAQAKTCHGAPELPVEVCCGTNFVEFRSIEPFVLELTWLSRSLSK